MPDEIMSPKEFKDRMKSRKNNAFLTCEAKESECVDLMCDLLTELGYGDGVKVYNEIPCE